MQSVYKYDNYREFLADFYAEKKTSAAGFSYQKFSQLAGLNSPNYLKLVIDGARNLTVANIHQFAKAMGLSFDQTEFFETLVNFNQSKLDEERTYYQRRMTEIKKRVMDIPTKRIRIAELLSAYYSPAVIVCVDGLRTETCLSEIEMKTGIKADQSRPVIEGLLRHGLLEVRDGVYKLNSDFMMSHDQKMTDAAHKNYLRSQLQLSQKRFEKGYEKDAKFFSYTFTTALKTGSFYIDRIASFSEELIGHANTEPAERVMQMNIQLFPFKR